ncbi:fatty acid desaturase [Kitasatospora sp. NPDC058190]|uniref:fatty acid desaturase n=1 Tax=Kitasatospora sp. NPDC058190 TaxID=3346371 RepID=UPI0036DEA84F
MTALLDHQGPSASPRRPEPGDRVRESMTRLPRALALPLTLLTGRPHLGQRPVRFTATRHLVNAFWSIGCGLVASATALATGGWWLFLLLPGWAMTLHGMRNLRMMVYHQCAHRNMWRRPRLDAALGTALAGLLVVQDFKRYSEEHVGDHHALHHMTLRDPTVQAFLVSLELAPGMSRGQMWRRVLAKIASPRFHLRFLAARVRSYLHAATPLARLCWVATTAVVAALATWLHLWTFVLTAWVLPLTFFYQISNTLRLCVKHTFPAPEQRVRKGREYFGSLTNAIFLGEPAPDAALPPGRRLLAWTRWWLRMLLVHFPARYLVLTGDTVCHDFHHRHPMSKDWADYIFAREADRVSGAGGWPDYRHVWGLVPAIDAVFDSLRAADPTEYSLSRLADINHRELFAAFDD